MHFQLTVALLGCSHILGQGTSVVLPNFPSRKPLKFDRNVITGVLFFFLFTLGVYQISKQIKAHDGSVFTLCQMRNGMLLTGGGKDRKVLLWDHDLNAEREIEVRMGK